MYFPYFRGKQFELVAVRDLIQQGVINGDGLVVPVIEPVKSSFGSLERTLSSLIAAEVPFSLIINPSEGDLKKSHGKARSGIVDPLLDRAELFMPGYIIGPETTTDTIRKLRADFPGRRLCLLHRTSIGTPDTFQDLCAEDGVEMWNLIVGEHVGRRYRRRVPRDTKVLVEDGFKKADTNAQFPAEEYFSDLVYSYQEEGYAGFGDFLIVGDHYAEGGGPAYAVAIHLTYEHEREEVWVKHFLSDRQEDQVDPAGKFMEALEYLVDFVDSADLSWSNACNEFVRLHREEHFPGLGYVKKLSMCHHVELMARILRRGRDG